MWLLPTRGCFKSILSINPTLLDRDENDNSDGDDEDGDNIYFIGEELA